MTLSLEYIDSILRRIPQDPGVYLMNDEEGKIIYVGKAKNLRKRVGSYFSTQNGDNNWKTSRLVSKINNIEFIITDNEIEAFLLESNLIKRYRPIFNIELKDQQRYTYLKVTDEIYPRLLVARRNRNGEFYGPKGKVYGPFVYGSSKFLTVGLLRKLFKIRICDKLPKKPCLEYFIKNCDAPCINNVSQDDYMKNVFILQDILKGKRSIENFANEMENEMRIASNAQQYERAKEIRDTLNRLNNLRIKQKMEKVVDRNSDEEYIGIIKDEAQGVAHIMTLLRTQGVITDRKKFEFDLIGDNSLATFISQYYSITSVIPKFIYVNEEPDSKSVLQSLLEQIAKHQVRIIKVSKGFKIKEKRQLMDLVVRNIAAYIEKGNNPSLIELKNILHLPTIPVIIDCFDISNFGVSYAVGACTRFVDGEPNKAGYRKFRIKKVSGQNDFAMISEIVMRRYSSSLSAEDNNTITKQDRIPNLIVIDGGKGQLHSATNAIYKLGIDIPCISIAKENEEIYTTFSPEPIILSKGNCALRLLQYIRDEAHRFGLAYNVNLRKLN